MKNIKMVLIYVAVLGVVGFLMFFSIQDPGDKASAGAVEGRPAPMVSLMDLDGKQWDLSKLKGSVVIVNFWATWCPPCKEEMPSLQRLYKKYSTRDDFEVLAVLYNDKPELAREYVKEGGFDFPILIDPSNNTAGTYGLTGVPETYFIDKSGVLRKKFMGPVEFDSKDAHDFADMLLSEKLIK